MHDDDDDDDDGDEDEDDDDDYDDDDDDDDYELKLTGKFAPGKCSIRLVVFFIYPYSLFIAHIPIIYPKKMNFLVHFGLFSVFWLFDSLHLGWWHHIDCSEIRNNHPLDVKTIVNIGMNYQPQVVIA